MTRMPLILMGEANGVRLGDSIGTKLKHWGPNVFNVYIEHENETHQYFGDQKG